MEGAASEKTKGARPEPVGALLMAIGIGLATVTIRIDVAKAPGDV
jgi:hypothetical protein